MPGSQFAERGLLAQLSGSVIGQLNQTITAPAAATAAITVRGSTGSGNIDTTPAAGQYLLMGTPGSGATQNQVSNLDVVQVTSATGTSVIIPAQTIGKSRAVGDYIWIVGTTTGGASPGFIFNDTWYIGLTTQAVSGATQANVLSGEPTSTGGYARIAALNNAATFGAARDPDQRLGDPRVRLRGLDGQRRGPGKQLPQHADGSAQRLGHHNHRGQRHRSAGHPLPRRHRPGHRRAHRDRHGDGHFHAH